MITSSWWTAVVLVATVALTGPEPEETVVDPEMVDAVVVDAVVVDGVTVEHVPEGVGSQVSTFDYEWEDVAFRSQVWERGPDAAGAYAVDLTVKVLRADRLTDLAATAAFLAEYHEQDPATWTAFDHHGQPGHRRPGSVFWWDAPGVAVEVSLDGERFPEAELAATALGIRPAAG